MIDITSNKDEIVRELGHRLAQKRLAMGWTQEELALRAGVAKKAVERLERAEGNSRLEVFILVMMALSLTQNFNLLLPEMSPSPFDVLRGVAPIKRARGKKQRTVKWGDEA